MQKSAIVRLVRDRSGGHRSNELVDRYWDWPDEISGEYRKIVKHRRIRQNRRKAKQQIRKDLYEFHTQLVPCPTCHGFCDNYESCHDEEMKEAEWELEQMDYYNQLCLDELEMDEELIQLGSRHLEEKDYWISEVEMDWEYD